MARCQSRKIEMSMSGFDLSRSGQGIGCPPTGGLASDPQPKVLSLIGGA